MTRTPARVVELAIGVTSTKAINSFFDYALYPLAIYRYGAFYGGALMVALDIFLCIIAVSIYDHTKRDWLGIESIKGLREYQGPKRSLVLTGKVLKRSGVLAFLFLSVKFDAFVTMLYMRDGAFNGMARREWSILLLSIFIGNLYWISAWCLGISLLDQCDLIKQINGLPL